MDKYQNYKLNPGNLLTPSKASITKQISPAIPNMSEQGLSLFPVIYLSLKLYVNISFITPDYSRKSAKNKAFL